VYSGSQKENRQIMSFFYLQMLAMLPGQERTAGEYKALFNQAGIELVKIIPTDSPYCILEGSAG
jgi:hypothetical protein